MRPTIIFTFLCLCVFYRNVDSYKVLGVFHMVSKSHYYVGHALMKGLADEGHEVTMVSPFKQEKPIKNYKEIVLVNTLKKSKKQLSAGNFLNFHNLKIWDMTFMFFGMGVMFTNFTLTDPAFVQLLESDSQFDVVIVEIFASDALLGLGHYFNAPTIGVSTFGASKYTTDLVGTPIIPSYIPHPFNSYSDKMNFWERIYNSFSYWFEDIMMPLFYTHKQQKLLEENYPNSKNMPSIEELKRNVSLVLLNTHVTLGSPRPYAPNMIEVGGLHINRNVEPLPANIQKFLDEAKDGAIYFSLGSNLQLSQFPADKKNAIINSFSEHPNVRVLIKTEENLLLPSHKVSDVFVQSWFPQEAILAHPNVKLFVTHGGLLSTTESIYFGKPVIGIPVFGDQYLNMRLAELKGYGEGIPYEHLTEDALKSAIKKILTNPRYTEQAQLASYRYRDQLRPPLETAIHWVNHVAKNKGAPHLRSVAVDLPFYVYYNLDIWAFIGLVLCILIATPIKLFQIICSSRSSTKILKKKTQ